MEAPLTAHVVELGHRPEDLRRLVIENLPKLPNQNIVRELHRRENAWIFRANSLAPAGSSLDLSCFL